MKGITIALALGALALAGCQKSLEQLNRDLAAVNQKMGTTNQSRPAPAGSMAMPVQQSQQIQLIVTNDERTEKAVEAALPTIKQVLAIHQCVRAGSGMLQLNALAIPGVNVASGGGLFGQGVFPNDSSIMKYHDKSKCVSIRAIDHFVMPALNALKFRVVYFAEDSGETVNLSYEMRKTDDGKWLLSAPPFLIY